MQSLKDYHLEQIRETDIRCAVMKDVAHFEAELAYWASEVDDIDECAEQLIKSNPMQETMDASTLDIKPGDTLTQFCNALRKNDIGYQVANNKGTKVLYIYKQMQRGIASTWYPIDMIKKRKNPIKFAEQVANKLNYNKENNHEKTGHEK